MTVKQVIAQLKKMDQDAEVGLFSDEEGNSTYKLEQIINEEKEIVWLIPSHEMF